MPYICPGCDNKTEFKKEVWGTEHFSGIEYLDEEGEYQDRDTDTGDIADEECGEIVCVNCGSEAEMVDDDKWLAWPEEAEDEPADWKELLEKRNPLALELIQRCVFLIELG